MKINSCDDLLGDAWQVDQGGHGSAQ